MNEHPSIHSFDGSLILFPEIQLTFLIYSRHVQCTTYQTEPVCQFCMVIQQGSISLLLFFKDFQNRCDYHCWSFAKGFYRQPFPTCCRNPQHWLQLFLNQVNLTQLAMDCVCYLPLLFMMMICSDAPQLCLCLILSLAPFMRWVNPKISHFAFL